MGCKDAYMMKVLAGAFTSKFTNFTTEIRTADSRKTTTRYADHALSLKTNKRMKMNIKWTHSHPEKDKTQKDRIGRKKIGGIILPITCRGGTSTSLCLGAKDGNPFHSLRKGGHS